MHGIIIIPCMFVQIFNITYSIHDLGKTKIYKASNICIRYTRTFHLARLRLKLRKSMKSV